MPRGKRKVDNYWGVEQTDDLMDSMFSEARNFFGEENFYTGSEAEQLIVGLPLPALCLRYLFQSTVYPLSRMAIITGQEGSCKSAMLYEMFRWHRLFGGRNILLECETKDSPDLRTSILGYDSKACGMKRCHSLEEWQKALTWFIEDSQKRMTGTKERPGPGRIIPFCIGIDSLMATASEENIKKILEQGYADRAHPLEALKISQFMKVWPQKLFRWPFSVIGTNHLKPTTDFMGRPGRNLPGGMSLKFQETYELEMARTGDIHRADHDGISVTITTRKNSLGPSRKQIKATLVWWNEYEEVPPEVKDQVVNEDAINAVAGIPQVQSRQRTMWNWHSASIDLLLEIQSKDRTRWKKIEEFLDLKAERSKGNMVWSRALGIPSEDKVPFNQAGAMLEERPDILNRLHALLGIRERFEFEPGKDFQQQMVDAKTFAAAHITDNVGPSMEPDPLETDIDVSDQ